MFSNRGKALTFDDILLVPSYSEVTPDMVDVSTWLTPEIQLKSPLLSAAMDTVTESAMAISMARMGGIGVIHKNMSIARQRLEVEKVKKSESGMILDPVTISSSSTVQEALDLMHDFSISGLPVVDDGCLKGILTNRDVRFVVDGTKVLVREVMTSENLITVPMGTSLEEAKRHLHEHRHHHQGHRQCAEVPQLLQGRSRPSARGSCHWRHCGHAGAHGAAPCCRCGRPCARLRPRPFGKHFAHHPRSEVRLPPLPAHCDCVKIGIGPGSICTTRIVAGVGVPQVTAIADASKAAREMDRCCIADGGIKFSGDIVKALTVGAHSIMIGSLFAGTEESPGETVLYQGRTYKVYRGMGSIDAMKEGSSDRYFQQRSKKFVPEGIVGRVPYRGSVKDVIYQLIGGLKSGMGYLGAASIPQLFATGCICEISPAGLRESHVHDIVITKEAPNYRLDNN